MHKDTGHDNLEPKNGSKWSTYADRQQHLSWVPDESTGPDAHKVINVGEVDLETGMKIVRHEIVDSHSAENPKDFQCISEMIASFESIGWQGDGNLEPDLYRKRKSSIDFDNPSTQAFINSAPCARDWLAIMPFASALEPLYNPNLTHYANGKPVSLEASMFFKNCMDAIGMRNRGKMMSKIISTEADGYDPSEPFVVYSVGCGSAVPVLTGMQEFQTKTGLSPIGTMVDLDKHALRDVKKNAKKLGLTNIKTRRKNIMEKSGVLDKPNWFKDNVAMRSLYGSGRLQPKNASIIDAVGVTEYLLPEDWPYTYKGLIDTEMEMAGAVTFLSNLSGLVKPGGKFVVGNMFDERPQLAFTLNTVQWPHIQPRSPKQMDDIFNAAGLPKNRTLHFSNDHLYGLYVIDYS